MHQTHKEDARYRARRHIATSMLNARQPILRRHGRARVTPSLMGATMRLRAMPLRYSIRADLSTLLPVCACRDRGCGRPGAPIVPGNLGPATFRVFAVRLTRVLVWGRWAREPSICM